MYALLLFPHQFSKHLKLSRLPPLPRYRRTVFGRPRHQVPGGVPISWYALNRLAEEAELTWEELGNQLRLRQEKVTKWEFHCFV